MGLIKFNPNQPVIILNLEEASVSFFVWKMEIIFLEGGWGFNEERIIF